MGHIPLQLNRIIKDGSQTKAYWIESKHLLAGILKFVRHRDIALKIFRKSIVSFSVWTRKQVFKVGVLYGG